MIVKSRTHWKKSAFAPAAVTALACFCPAALWCGPAASENPLLPGFSLVDHTAETSGRLALASGSSNADSPQAESPQTDECLRKADLHFSNGRQYYFQGNLASAHREFDAAINTLLTAPENAPDRKRLERRLDELCDLIYRFDLEKLGAGGDPDAQPAFDEAPIDEISHMTFPVDPSIAARLKSELHQTASGIPLELSDPVLSFVHYFSTDRGRAILLSGLRRSGRYRPMIQRILAEEGVPQELIYLAQAESGFLPRAVSNKKAVGMWQFISYTGATYDLVKTSALDERFDPEKATRAAAKFLKDLYTRYGDWYLAMAAYNCGPGAVDRAVERTGYADYWELLKRNALPRETASYVPIIVAMTIMAKNPHDYGLENVELDEPLAYDSIQLTASTNLNLVADATMQPLSVIRDLNPALLKMVVPGGLRVRVPKGSAESAMAALERVPAANRDAWRLHHVEKGDTLQTIARAYHLPANRIVSVNNTSGSSLDRGEVLLIPAVYHEPAPRVSRRSRTTRKRAAVSSSRSSKTTATTRGAHISAAPVAARATVRARVAHK